jgi:hypothetical protein
MFLTLVPQKIFFIIVTTKTLELTFIHLCPSQFLDLERSGRRGRINRSSVRNKGGFVVLGGENLLGFLGSLSIFQPSLRASH